MNARTSILPALCFALLAVIVTPAESAVVKCKSADGSTTYTENTCPPGTKPADLPEGISSYGGSSLNSTPQTVSSPQAAAYQQAIEDCLKSDNDTSFACQNLESMTRACKTPEAHATENCAALRQAAAAARAHMNLADPQSKKYLRQICGEDGGLACMVIECPFNIFVEGTDEQVRACSARLQLPTSSSWVQWDKNHNGSYGTTRYICLKKFSRMNSIGEIRPYRQEITVVSMVPKQGMRAEHAASTLPNEVFADRNEAATAGCAAVKQDGVPSPPPGKPSAPRNPQGV